MEDRCILRTVSRGVFAVGGGALATTRGRFASVQGYTRALIGVMRFNKVSPGVKWIIAYFCQIKFPLFFLAYTIIL